MDLVRRIGGEQVCPASMLKARSELIIGAMRFEKWIQAVEVKELSSWIQEHMPPVDVIMVWQAYMLNPRYVCIRNQRHSMND